MTFLAPALLTLAAATLVPILLHLLQRQQGPRVVFPALRYLRRAERENATRIRLRQMLLLVLRVLALLLLAGAAARPYLSAGGAAHAPTSVVIILDNSLSSGAVVEDRRVLDRLQTGALAALSAAGLADRFWLIRAGEPWVPAVVGPAERVAAAVRETGVSGGAADLSLALERASSILAGEPQGRPREILLLSDLQASGFPPVSAPAGPSPAIRVLDPEAPIAANRAVMSVEVGGGLPPRAGEASTVTAETGAWPDGVAAGDSSAVRLSVEGSVRGAGRLRPGAATVLPFPARGPGLVWGHVELDPDLFRADDRRYFALEISPPTPVALAEPEPFLVEAVDVLEEAGRIRQVGPTDADIVVAPGARGAEAVRRGAGAVILPPSSPLELGAANQRLAGAGIPWRFGPPQTGETGLDTAGAPLPEPLAQVRLRQVYPLESETPGTVLIRLRTGAPWAVAGSAADGGRYVLLGSPLTPDAGTLPTSAAMVPLLDLALSRWAVQRPEPWSREPGDLVTVAGDIVIGPEGEEPVRPGSTHRLRIPGLHVIRSGNDTVAVYAVNPPASESFIERLDARAVADRLAGRDVRVADAGEWLDIVFHERIGVELTPWLVALALLLLLVEAAVAAAGRRRAPGSTPGLARGEAA